MAEFAKWSIVVIMAYGALTSIFVGMSSKNGQVGIRMIGLLVNGWIIVAICVWWRS